MSPLTPDGLKYYYLVVYNSRVVIKIQRGAKKIRVEIKRFPWGWTRKSL